MQEHLVQESLSDHVEQAMQLWATAAQGRSQCSELLWPQVSRADPIPVLLLGQLANAQVPPALLALAPPFSISRVEHKMSALSIAELCLGVHESQL